jgi:hypothetical protein
MYSTADIDLLLLFRFRLEFVGIQEIYQIYLKVLCGNAAT